MLPGKTVGTCRKQPKHEKVDFALGHGGEAVLGVGLEKRFGEGLMVEGKAPRILSAAAKRVLSMVTRGVFRSFGTLNHLASGKRLPCRRKREQSCLVDASLSNVTEM